MGLVFQGITAVSLGVMTIKMTLDMIRDARRTDGDRNDRRHR